MSMIKIEDLKADKISVDDIVSAVLYGCDDAYGVLKKSDVNILAGKKTDRYLVDEDIKEALETLQAPEFIEEEIRYIRSNLDMSWLKKRKLIRVLKKELKERRKNGRCKEM